MAWPESELVRMGRARQRQGFDGEAESLGPVWYTSFAGRFVPIRQRFENGDEMGLVSGKTEVLPVDLRMPFC